MKRAYEVEYRCPITYEMFVDPVDADDGKTYERWAIVRWATSHSRSPLIPSTSISVDGLRPNAAMKAHVSSLMVDDAVRTEWLETRASIASRLFRSGDIAGAAALEHPVAMTKMALDGSCMAWMEKAAMAGERNAMRMLGQAYRFGRGKERSLSTALEWYTRAAELGDFIAIEEALHVSVTLKSIPNVRRWASLGNEQGSSVCKKVCVLMKI